MKLPELKKKFTKKYVIRIIAGVLVIGMVGTGVSTANVFAAKTAQESTESTENTENTENTEYETDSGSAGQSSSDGTKTDGAGEENQNTDENEQAGADE